MVDEQDMVQPILMDQQEARGEEIKFSIEIPQTTIIPNNNVNHVIVFYFAYDSIFKGLVIYSSCSS